MQDIVKKSILFGMGAVRYTKDSVDEFVNDLSKEGINPEEGKKMIENLVEDAKKAKDEQMDEIKKVVRNTLNELGVATKSDIESLKKSLRSKE